MQSIPKEFPAWRAFMRKADRHQKDHSNNECIFLTIVCFVKFCVIDAYSIHLLFACTPFGLENVRQIHTI